MNGNEARAFVLTHYPEAWIARSPWPDRVRFYCIPYERSIGSIGAGNSGIQAWKDAAQAIQRRGMEAYVRSYEETGS